MTASVDCVWDGSGDFSESCVWDAVRRRILFCDIHGRRILAYGTDTGATQAWSMADIVASIALCRSGRLVVALRNRVVLFNTRSGGVEDFTAQVDEPAGNRFNGGKVGPDGCFWVGSMAEQPAGAPTGALYRVSPDGRIERKSDGYSISSGLAWSPDGRTMYHADSGQGLIEAWDFDVARGRITNRRRLVSETDGRPGGAAMAADGNYWSAGGSAGRLNRFSPDGTLLEQIAMPAPAPAALCFAAEWLYVTASRVGPDTPRAGGLFRLVAPVAGAPVDDFADY